MREQDRMRTNILEIIRRSDDAVEREEKPRAAEDDRKVDGVVFIAHRTP